MKQKHFAMLRIKNRKLNNKYQLSITIYYIYTHDQNTLRSQQLEYTFLTLNIIENNETNNETNEQTNKRTTIMAGKVVWHFFVIIKFGDNTIYRYSYIVGRGHL